MLATAYHARGIAFIQIGFPNYEGFFGKLVARFLNGEFGPLPAVDPHFSALLYAGDRLESKSAIESALASGAVVLADRYVGSNLAHQGARVPPEKREAFLKWLTRLEYEIYALPPEDLVIYLRLPVAEAHRLVGQKGARDYSFRGKRIGPRWSAGTPPRKPCDPRNRSTKKFWTPSRRAKTLLAGAPLQPWRNCPRIHAVLAAEGKCLQRVFRHFSATNAS
jgi:thymidylate kinase